MRVQRRENTAGRLLPHRKELLNKLGFTWDPFDEDWKQNYQEFKQYLHDGGNPRVDKKHKLYKWAAEQRRAKVKGKISDERISLLNKIGFLWDLHDEDWRSMYNLLVQYYRENGNTNVPGRHPTLGKWVNRNRMARKNGKLSDERIKLLDDIDFIWDTREDNWRKMYF